MLKKPSIVNSKACTYYPVSPDKPNNCFAGSFLTRYSLSPLAPLTSFHPKNFSFLNISTEDISSALKSKTNNLGSDQIPVKIMPSCIIPHSLIFLRKLHSFQSIKIIRKTSSLTA